MASVALNQFSSASSHCPCRWELVEIDMSHFGTAPNSLTILLSSSKNQTSAHEHADFSSGTWRRADTEDGNYFRSLSQLVSTKSCTASRRKGKAPSSRSFKHWQSVLSVLQYSASKLLPLGLRLHRSLPHCTVLTRVLLPIVQSWIIAPTHGVHLDQFLHLQSTWIWTQM